MRRRLILITAALAIGGCATAAKRVRQAKKGLVAIDIAAETDAKAIEAARRAKIAACRARDLPTPELREACLGKLKEPLGPLAASAAAAYDQAVDALDALSEALEALEQLRRAAQETE